MKIRILLTIVVGGLLAAGCDDKPAPPPKVLAPANKPVLVKAGERPTTREILACPRHTVQIGTYPLRIEVPEIWQTQALGPATVVRGPAPAADLMIAFARLDSPDVPGTPALFSKATLDVLTAATTRPATNPADKLSTTLVRASGSAQIVETRSIRPETATLDDRGKPALSPAMLQINMTIYVPQADKYAGYRMMLSLPVDQYEADREFIEKILASIQFDPALAAIDTVPAPK